MKKSNLMTVVKLAGALVALVYLTACGSNMTGSGFGAANLSSTSATSTSAVARCSKDMSNISDFQIHVEAAYDQFGNIQPSNVRVAIIASPSDWATSNYDLQFYRWSAVTNGTVTSTNVNTTAMGFQFERTYGGGTYYSLVTDASGNAPTYTVINSSEIMSYGQVVGLSYTSAQVVMNQVHFLVNLQDATGAYQVVRAVLRDKTSGAVVRQVDALIPTFYANPTTYNAQVNSSGQLMHPAMIQALHPLETYAGQGWTESQYQSFMNAFCF